MPSRYSAFLSTPSARRATRYSLMGSIVHSNFYPRPPRGGRPLQAPLWEQVTIISIHALREEGDRTSISHQSKHINFYPRPPRGGRRDPRCDRKRNLRHFYPRPPRGGRRKRMTPIPFREQFLSTPSARRATAKTETKSLFSNKLYNILHEFRRALIYNGSKNYPNHAK